MDEVPLNERQLESVPSERIRIQDGVRLIDRTITLGCREIIAGVEHALLGMKVGGYRKVRISPHLAYRENGLPGLVPSNAVLVAEIWLRAMTEERKV